MSVPLPPPTSTTSSSPDQSRPASRSIRRSGALNHRSVERCPLVGVRGEPGPEVVLEDSRKRGHAARGVEGARRAVEDAAEEVREIVPTIAPQELRRLAVLRKVPGSSSAKTPSLASARSRRCSTSVSAPTSRATSATGRGPAASASATRSSATRPSAREVSAPRMRSQRRASGESIMLAQLRRPPPPRPPRRPSACGSRAAASRPVRSRPPVARRNGATRRAPPPRRRRSSGSR